jgi:RNA polymerase sigma-70 factor (ECF subfamily)
MQTDERLIVSYLDGEEHSLEVLIERYTDHIFNFIRQYIGNQDQTEDLTQEVFVKVWKNIKKFNVEKSFKVWLFQIARNSTIDFLRKKKEIHFSEIEDEDGELNFEDSEQNIEDILEKKESQEKVKRLFDLLPVKYKSVLSMHYQSELNFREISEITGLPLDTVKSRHRRAILMIKKNLV